MSAEVMPEEFAVRPRGGLHIVGDLAEAARLANENAGRWVQVGAPRFLSKPPTTWCFEVMNDKKVVLAGTQCVASYDETGRTEGSRKEYRKFIKILEGVPQLAYMNEG